MASAASPRQGRSRLAALVLSGLAPGAGHLFVGRPNRGVVAVALVAAAFWGWVLLIPVSWTAARLGLLLPVALLVALLADATRLAPAAPRPSRLTASRLAGYAAFVVVAGFVLPSLLVAALQHRILLVTQPDDHMLSARISAGDVVLCDQAATRGRPPRRDAVVVVAAVAGATLRRVVALPGERFDVRRGVVRLEGREWVDDLRRPFRGRGLFLGESRVPAGAVAVLSDARDPAVDARGVVPLESLRGAARYVLLPTDLDPLRVGEAVR